MKESCYYEELFAMIQLDIKTNWHGKFIIKCNKYNLYVVSDTLFDGFAEIGDMLDLLIDAYIVEDINNLTNDAIKLRENLISDVY